jgi:hypothetical protein
MPIMSSPSPAALRAAHRLHHEWLKCSIPISPDGIATIIQTEFATERAEAEQQDRLKTAEINILVKENRRLHAERAELIEALRFYANGQRYKGSNQEPIEGDPYGPKGFVYLWDVMRDGGAIANKALAKYAK